MTQEFQQQDTSLCLSLEGVTQLHLELSHKPKLPIFPSIQHRYAFEMAYFGFWDKINFSPLYELEECFQHVARRRMG